MRKKSKEYLEKHLYFKPHETCNESSVVCCTNGFELFFWQRQPLLGNIKASKDPGKSQCPEAVPKPAMTDGHMENIS